jgi:sulfur-carrier protein
MAQHAGISALALGVPPQASLASVRNEVLRRHPRLPWPDGTMIALNQEYAAADTVLHNGDEVAVIPPVSGG